MYFSEGEKKIFFKIHTRRRSEESLVGVHKKKKWGGNSVETEDLKGLCFEGFWGRLIFCGDKNQVGDEKIFLQMQRHRTLRC